VPEPTTIPPRGTKLTPRYLATLVLSAILILVVGSALRPRKPSSEAVPPPTQTEVRRLQRLAERQSLELMADHLAGTAADVASRLVRVGEATSTGIVWSPALVVTAGTADPVPESTTVVTGAGERLGASRVVGSPDLPLFGYQVAEPLEPATRRDGSAPELSPGQWLVAVWRGSAGPAFAPGHYVETRPVRCGELLAREVATTLDPTTPMAGGGVFDLDEALVAVVLPCQGRYAALSLESVTLGLVQGRGFDARLRGLYGLHVLPLEAPVRQHLRIEAGVLVGAVWGGFAAERAGLRPGDVIASLDGQPVVAPEDLQPLLAPGDREEAVVGTWRARQRREVRLRTKGLPVAPGGADAGSGLRLATSADGFAIDEVTPGSTAAEAGIRPGDRLLRVDFVAPRSAVEARRVLFDRDDRAVFVEVQSGPKRFGALLRPR
jgi:hypothetical protein